MFDPMPDVLAAIERQTGTVVAPEVKLADLGLDSLEFTDLVMDLEDVFGIEFPDTFAPDDQSVRGLADVIRELGGV